MSAATRTVPVDDGADDLLPRRAALWVFVSFAVAYFFSALLRAVTATLAPSFSAELGLNAGDLGLLAGAFFFGFAATQLPLGSALDRFGPRRVVLVFLSLAVAGCAAFALARDFLGLTLARTLIGVGVSACLMAPMTAYRRGFTPTAQLRANSWMLMTGSLGMVASTLPVQWLLPSLGWRGLFWVVGAGVAVSMLGIAWCVPRDRPAAGPSARERHPAGGAAGRVWRGVSTSDVPASRTHRVLPPGRTDRSAGALGRALARAGVRLDARRGGTRPVRHQRRDASELSVLGAGAAAPVFARLDGPPPDRPGRAVERADADAGGRTGTARGGVGAGALLHELHGGVARTAGAGLGLRGRASRGGPCQPTTWSFSWGCSACNGGSGW